MLTDDTRSDRTTPPHRRLAALRLSSDLRRGAAAGVAIYAAAALVRTLWELLFARLMGASEFGAYSYAFSWLSILAVAAGLGLPYAFVRFIPQYAVAGDASAQRRLASFARRTTIWVGLVLACVATAAITALRPAGSEAATVIVGMLGVPLLALLTLESELARGFLRVVLAYLPFLVLRPLLALLFGVAVAVGAGGLTATEGLAAGVLAMALCAVGQRSRIRGLLAPRGETVSAPSETAERRAWLHVALPLLLVNLLAIIAMRADVIVVGAVRGSHAAGVYAVAARVALLASFALEALNTIVAPTISRHYYAGERAAVQHIVRTAARITFACALAATALLMLAGSSSLAIFGPGFGTGMAALEVLLIGQLVNASTGPVTYLMIAGGEQNLAALAQAVSTGLFLALAIPLTAAWGIVGAAAAVTVSRALVNVWMAIAAQRRLGIRSFVL